MRKTLAIVGRGAVGSALVNGLHDSELFRDYGLKQYHSKNIQSAYFSSPDVLIYAGVSGTKYAAEMSPIEDLQSMKEALRNMQLIGARKTILISTIDADEKVSANSEYGLNRRFLENRFLEEHENGHVLRLPALYGSTVYKNQWYDVVADHTLPNSLTTEYFEHLQALAELSNKFSDTSLEVAGSCEAVKYLPNKEAFREAGVGLQLITKYKAKFYWLDLDNIITYVEASIKNDYRIAMAVTRLHSESRNQKLFISHKFMLKRMNENLISSELEEDIIASSITRNSDYTSVKQSLHLRFICLDAKHSPFDLDYWRKQIDFNKRK